MPNVTVRTPRSDALSAGLVCFEVRGADPEAFVGRLRARGIVATVTPYSPPLVRVAPSILNTPAEVRTALARIRELA